MFISPPGAPQPCTVSNRSQTSASMRRTLGRIVEATELIHRQTATSQRAYRGPLGNSQSSAKISRDLCAGDSTAKVHCGRKIAALSGKNLVPRAGLEPACACARWILSSPLDGQNVPSPTVLIPTRLLDLTTLTATEFSPALESPVRDLRRYAPAAC